MRLAEEPCYRWTTNHNLEVNGDVATGQLSNIGAQLLLVRDGQDHLRPVIAAGRFTLWLSGGRVERFKIELEGIRLVNGQECLVHQVSTTELHDVGTAHRELPEAVRRKLEP